MPVKLRVKVRATGARHLVTIEEPDASLLTLDHIKHAIYRQIPALPDNDNADTLQLSLNGVSLIPNENEDLISEIGIVSGDLIHIINGEAGVVVDPSSSSQSLTNDTINANLNINRDTSSSWTSFERYSTATAVAEESEMEAKPTTALAQPSLTVSDYRDGESLPPLLQSVYDAEKPASKIEAMVVLSHALLLERNFMLVEGPKFPKDWRANVRNKLTFQYQHPKCGDVKFSINLINMMGSTCIVQAKAILTDTDSLEESDSLKHQLKPDQFVEERQLDSPTRAFKCLQQLSIAFHDAIVDPLLSEGLRMNGVENGVADLYSLPYAVMTRILSFLDFRSLIAMSQTSSFFNELGSSPFLWKALCRRDLGMGDRDSVVDWKGAYKEGYVARKQERERRRFDPFFEPLPHNPFNGNDFFPPPPPFGPPGFLGGDHDLFPQGLPFPRDPFGGGRGTGPLGPFLPRPRMDPNFPRPRNPGPFGGPGRNFF